MKPVLIATDGSAYSDACCQYAAWLATRLGSNIEGVYVSNLINYELSAGMSAGGGYGMQPAQLVIDSVRQIEDEKAKKIKLRTEEILSTAGFDLAKKFKFHHQTGSFVDRIEEMETGIEALVVGKRGENSNFAKRHLGSSMERVVRATHIPCLVTPNEYRDVKIIALAYDGGDSTNKMLDFFLKQKLFSDLELHIISVAEKADSDAQNQAKSHLQKAQEITRSAGFPAKTHLLEGKPADAIVDFVERNEIDLLGLGAYGHSKLHDLFLGSTTTDIIYRSKVPLMLFH